MKKTDLLLIFLFGFVLISPLVAQTSFSTGDGVAVFYPNAFDPTQTLPSFAISNEPAVQTGVPAGWKITPVFSAATGKTIATLNCGTADFYGTGEVTGNLKRNNTSITLWNSDNYGYDSYQGKRLYQSHPWVMGLRPDGTAFGIIADNTWRMNIDITNTSVVFTSDGPAFRVLVFEAASPQKVLEKLAALTGKMELPPVWSLGYQQCRYSYMTDKEAKSVADTFRLKKLPCDVIWMDIDYMDQYKIFTFSPAAFPDPAGLNKYLHDKKFKSVWMIDPGIKQQAGYGIYDQGTAAVGTHWVQKSNNTTFVGTVWPGNCVFPDYTRPETRTWWAGLYPAFMATGIDGVWNDMNEPSVFTGGVEGSMPATNKHRGGGGLPAGTHLRYHNVYGQLMVQASRQGILQANPAKRPFVLSRSNFLGGQKYAATWTGDNQSTTAHMQLSVPMVLTMGLSGQPISGPDVGGYKGDCTADLLGHWMALGTFYPFYRNHAEKGTARQEPWAFTPAIENSSRTSLERRYRLLPYLYSLAQEAATTGIPVMRPMFFADPADANLRDQQQTFLLGDILMVVPKWASNVKYPSGTWNLISLVGENSKTDTYQPDVLQKAGTILPLGQIIQSSSDYTADSLTLIVSLDAAEKATGNLYTDAGEGFGYQTGQYLMRDFNIQPLGNDSLLFTASVRSGQMPVAGNRYRVGIVTGNSIVYTAWTSNTTIKIPKSYKAYNGLVKNIPGKIEAEEYNIGGETLAYHDLEAQNKFNVYRTGEGVDVEATTDGGPGYNVGYIENGEWLSYSVNVQKAGTYTLEVRAASLNAGTKTLHVEMDGIDVSGPVSFGPTAGWQTFKTFSITTAPLTAGAKTMRLVIDAGGFNLNYVNFLNTVITSVEEADGMSDINVFPNPVNAGGNIEIRFNNKEAVNYQVHLYNYLGQSVYQWTVNARGGTYIHSLELPQQLSPGYYQTEIVSESGQRIMKKIVIY